MKSLDLGRLVLGAAIVAAMLPGCGGSSTFGVMPAAGGATAPQTTSGGDLLYVANETAAKGVTILDYPTGTYVATITNIGAPQGICSDSSGNVWVAVRGPRRFYLYEFAHGGTTPIKMLYVPKGAYGCAVDPTTGDLATWTPFAGSAGQVDVFAAAKKAKPIVYQTDFEPTAGAYDDQGNFFADGIVNSGDFIFKELARGSKSFTTVRLSKPAANPGSVQWDGKYIVVGVGFISDPPMLYRVRVADYIGTVVGRVGLDRLDAPAQFAIADGNVVAREGESASGRLGLYDYPAGGKRLAIFSGFYKPRGMTVSVSAPAQRGDLLYVANRRESEGVSILTFPQGTPIGKIDGIGKPKAVCADRSGNVWVASYQPGPDPFKLYKFRRGETKPIEALKPHRDVYGCAVDPSTGNLATISYGGSSDGVIDIYAGARKVKPAVYFTAGPPAACAYDDSGDLFVDGAGSLGVELLELVKGAKYFTNVSLGRNSGWWIGSVQWDGTDVALGIGTISGSSSIYRVKVSGTRGKIAAMVQLQHLARWPHFAFVDGQILATQGGHGVRRLGLYDYPSGGKQLQEFSGFHDPLGIAISVAPN